MSAGMTTALMRASRQGTRAMMATILVGVPLGFLTNLLVGRWAGPTGLGYYALVALLVSTIQTFLLFGGAPVVVNWLPRLPRTDRWPFLLSYGGLALGFAAGITLLLAIVPGSLAWLLQSHIPTPLLFLLVLLFAPLIILQTLTIAALQAEMAVGLAARVQYGVQVVTFCLVGLAFLGGHVQWLGGLSLVALCGLAYAITLGYGGYHLYGLVRTRWQWTWRWLLPRSFWSFAVTFHLHTLATFFLAATDQFVVLTFTHSVALVGMLRAATVVTGYIYWAPSLVTGALYPLFTNLLSIGDIPTLHATYRRYALQTSAIVTIGGCVVAWCAPLIAMLFGHGFGRPAVHLILIFALMYVLAVGAAYVPTSAYLTARGDVLFNLLANTLALLVRLGLALWWLSPVGIEGVALADLVSLVVLHGISVLYLRWRYRVTPPVQCWFISGGGTIITLLACHWHW